MSNYKVKLKVVTEKVYFIDAPDEDSAASDALDAAERGKPAYDEHVWKLDVVDWEEVDEREYEGEDDR